MKYTPKKVFILEDGKYIEMPYEEFNRRKQEDESYREKRFLSLHGMLMEVTKEEYLSYYKDKRRQRYIDERAKKFGTFSYDALTTDEFNGEDILVDSVTDISKEVEYHLMLEKLLNVFQGLTSDEQALVKAIYFDGLSEREYAAQLGVYPNAVHKRKRYPTKMAGITFRSVRKLGSESTKKQEKCDRRIDWKGVGTGVEGLSNMSDREVTERALKSADKDFEKLYGGQDLFSDHSRSDMALMSRLAFWCNGDKEQMLRVFATSGLYRLEKSPDYYEGTAIKCIQGNANRYTPRKEQPATPPKKAVGKKGHPQKDARSAEDMIKSGNRQVKSR